MLFYAPDSQLTLFPKMVVLTPFYGDGWCTPSHQHIPALYFEMLAWCSSPPVICYTPDIESMYLNDGEGLKLVSDPKNVENGDQKLFKSVGAPKPFKFEYQMVWKNYLKKPPCLIIY